MPDTTKQVDRPIPNDAARRGLLHVETMDVGFSGGTDRDQEEALNHINELIAFWNLKYIDWIPNHGRSKGAATKAHR